MIKDENLSLEDKQKLAQNLVERYLRENGYQGEIPEVLLTDEAHSFTVDSKDKSTGAKRREKIYFSINDIANPDLPFSQLFGYEKAHMNTYDEGKDGEETSIHTREKIGSENKNKVFTEEEKADYLNNLRNKYKNQKSIEQQFAEAKIVDEKDKEHWAVGVSINGSAAFGGRDNGGRSKYFIYNENSKELKYVKATDIGIGLGTIGVGISGSIVFLKNVNTVEDLKGHSFVFGGSYTVAAPLSAGLEIIFDSNREFSGVRIVGGVGKTIKAAPPLDGYFAKILMYEIVFGWIIFWGVCFTGTLFFNLSLEKIEIIKNRKLINIIGDGVNLRLTSKNKIKVEILVTKEHFFFTRASFKQMCTMTFTIDNEKKYKWGFRLSEKKAKEIKKILENTEVEFNE